MTRKNQTSSVHLPKQALARPSLLGWLTLLASLGASTLPAANVIKANNTDNLNLTTSWSGGVAPTAADVAVWDSTVTGPNTVNLGASASWYGLRIANPGGSVLVLSNAPQTLTLGLGGIDMSAATQDLSLTNALTIGPGGLQQWNLAAGRTLALLAPPSKPSQPVGSSSGGLQLSTTGTIKLGSAAANLLLDTGNNPYATYGTADWAALDASGNAIAATYTDASTALSAGANNNVIGDFNINATVDVASLRFNDATPHTVNISTSGTSRTLTARGILMTPNCAGATIGGTITTSFIRPNRVSTVGAAFPIFQNCTTADLTINATFGDASSSTPVQVLKFGPGNLNIGGGAGNSIRGGVVINGGSLTLTPGTGLGSAGITVNSGKLVLGSGGKISNSAATFNAGTTNTLKITAAAGQVFHATNLTFSAGATRLEFSYGSGIAMSSTAAPLVTSNLTASGTVTIDIYNGSLSVGTYPLIKCTNTVNFAAFALGFLPPRVSANLNNNTANGSIDLVVTAVDEPITWATGSGVWDVNTTANWLDQASVSTAYLQAATPYGSLGDAVLFGDGLSGTSPITVTLNTAVNPASVTVNATKTFTISGSGSIGGSASLTKSGTGTLTLGTANSFSGALTLNQGIVNFSALTNLGAGPINFGGGTLQYAPGNVDDISVRTVTFNAGGATIDTGAGVLNFANPVGNNGLGGLTKTGAGALTLNGTNRYAGNTVVSQGTLTLGPSTSISNSAAIIVNTGALLDASASGLALNGSANQVLAGSGTVNGAVTTTSTTTITPATNGIVGTLTIGGDLTFNGGTYAYDVSTTAHDLLVVNGNLTLNAGTILTISAGNLANGVYKVIQYTGSLLSGAGSSANLVISGFSQAGKLAQLSDATPGEIDLIITTQGGAQITWQGDGVNNYWDIETTADFTNSSGAAAVFVQGDKVTFNDTSFNTTVNLEAAVQPGSVTVNGSQSYTFQSAVNGKLSGSTGLTNNSSGTLTVLTANNNTGPTVINAGTVQVGNGATTGDLGTGNIINQGAVVFNQPDNRSVAGQISGSGSLTQEGFGTLTLQQNNTYTGPTIIQYNSTLQVGTGGAAGSLGSGAVTNSGTLIFNHSGSFTLGNIQAGPSGGGAVALNGPATVTFAGGNTYQNNTAISNGLVKLSGNDQIPDGNSVLGSTGWLVLDGGSTAGVLDLNGFNETVNALSGLGGTVNGMITNSGTTGTNTLTILGTAGSTYNGTLVENPSGAKVALVLLGNNELRLNGNNTYSAGTFVGNGATIGVGPGGSIGTGGILLSNGAGLMLHSTGSTSVNAGNPVTIPDNAAASFNSSALGNTFGGTILGGPTATNLVVGPVSCAAANLQQYWPFSGTVQIQSGGTLRFSASSGLNNGGTNTTFDVEGSGILQTRNAGTVTLGALIGNGFINNPQANSGTGTFVIGTKNSNCTFSGTVQATNSIVKVGTGTLTFDGTLSYVGSTTVSNGVLALGSVNNPSVSLDNSPTINLEGTGAVLDVSALTDPTLYLGNLQAQTLNGFGTIRGSLNEGANSTVNVSVATLTVNNTAALNGVVNLWLNRTNPITASELLAGTFNIGATAVLNVTNAGPNLVNGDTFRLFSKPVSGFASVNLPAFDSTGTNALVWNNNLAMNGTIQLASGGVSPVNPTPTNLTAVVSGNTLTLSWPADRTGWRLLQQTNNLPQGLSTNSADWGTVAGSSSTNKVILTVDPNKATEFFRMVYP